MKGSILLVTILMTALLSVGQQNYDKTFPFGKYLPDWALVCKGGQYGFISNNGTEIVKPQYDEIYKFGKYLPDWALVCKGGQFGFISSNGTEIVKPKYDEIKINGHDIDGYINGEKETINK
ncbi:MAG: WG repeat-containing protein [Bacteroidia bacterium]|nr:WG repeat-containing protein [Bacteroidia bacterium]